MSHTGRDLTGVWHRYDGAEAVSFVDLDQRIHVWRVGLDDLGDEVGQNLSTDEKARAERCHRPDDRRRFVAARSILRSVLADILDSEDEPRGASLRFDYSAAGKPFLLNDPSLRFNLSHSEGLAVIAATRLGEVGIDVERLRPIPDMDKVVRLAFSEAERTAMMACPPMGREAVFYRTWTRKEALLKATGAGLSALSDPEAASLDQAATAFMVTTLPHLDGYVGSLARPRAARGLRLWSWPNVAAMRSVERRARSRSQLAPAAASMLPFDLRR